jgi:hypothetical protein
VSSDERAATGNGGTGMTALVGSTNDLAVDTPRSRVDQILQWVPRILSSKPHVVLLMGLGIYLIVLPILGVTVSANAELIGGNYTNVTSDLGACIAAGLTVHLVKRDRRRSRELAELIDSLHVRHDTLEKGVASAVAAAQRAEAAAVKGARGL